MNYKIEKKNVKCKKRKRLYVGEESYFGEFRKVGDWDKISYEKQSQKGKIEDDVWFRIENLEK